MTTFVINTTHGRAKKEEKGNILRISSLFFSRFLVFEEFTPTNVSLETVLV